MFKREKYLKQLIDKKNNHWIKVITGLRRCGKSFLLNNIFYNYLINEEKVPKNHIIRFAFDVEEDISSLEKKEQEYESLRNISDSFKKIIIVKNQGLPFYTDEGFLRISLMDFLTNDNSLDY
mgnify:CR=1 FL=1